MVSTSAVEDHAFADSFLNLQDGGSFSPSMVRRKMASTSSVEVHAFADLHLNLQDDGSFLPSPEATNSPVAWRHEQPHDDHLMVNACPEMSCTTNNSPDIWNYEYLVNSSHVQGLEYVVSGCGEDSRGSPTTLNESESGKREQLGRGEHVKDRPELSKNARDGQRFWAEQWQNLKAKWDRKNLGGDVPAFARQLKMKRATNTKAKSAALLLMLQMCARENIIIPNQFEDNTKTSFLGWTGFQVNKFHGQEFRRRIQSLFPDPNRQDTKRLNGILRDVHLVPRLTWVEAWKGQSPFVFKPAGENTNGRRFRA